ncbi:cytochrome P450 [Pendulispora albinea]|uniref:cytochrome P450 n=1 Tax=Pendulispora albinea TaxID=2741071 RepID=UPI00374E0540
MSCTATRRTGHPPRRSIPSDSPDQAGSRPCFAYLRFGGGPRQCIGGHFAMMEAQLVTAMIVRQHRLAPSPAHTIERDPKVSLRPQTWHLDGPILRR